MTNNMLQKKVLLMACACGMVLNSTAKENKRTEQKAPNLLYIFPDQYRMHALSIWSDPAYKEAIATAGDPVHTPNLDKLAKKGILFNNVCSTFPVSSPHRGMLMSGMYPRANGIENNCHISRDTELKHDIECLTDVLAKAGYETAYVGKTHWHRTEVLFDKNMNYVGVKEAPGGEVLNVYDTYIPEGKSRHSNKFWFQGLKSHYTSYTFSNRPELVGGKKDGQVQVYDGFTAAHEADIVIKYLKNENGERIAGKPFSMIWSINPPHPPYSQLSDCDVEVYNKYYKDMPAEQLFVRDNAKSGNANGKKKKKNIEMNARIYFTLIKMVDEEIGRVLDTLEEIGETDNTIVVFTSDHGEMLGSHGITGKNKIYDESFIVPYIISYPNVLKHRVENLMMGSVDIMPTMLGLMGLEKMIPATVAGRDYSDGLVTGQFRKNPKPESALYLNDKSKGVRTYQYSYVVNQDGSYELYDIKSDPYQMKNLRLNDIPTADAAMLKNALGKWLVEANDRWCDKQTNSALINYNFK